MISLLLVATAAIFSEIGTSLGKYEVSQKKESLYALGFLSTLWSAVFLFIFGITNGELIFSYASLPFFLMRAVIEIILLFVTLNAITSADRTTFSFLRIITIPLLLVVDIALGYNFSLNQIIGISIIVIALIFLFLNHGLSRKGKFLSLISSILAVATIALYKYNITHYNSVEAEQILMHLIILVALIVAAKVRVNENLFSYLTNRTFLIQSISSGIAGAILSFAYIFAQASIVTAAKRSFEILLALLFGRKYFHEKHIIIKTIALILIVAGVILTIV